MNKKGFTLVELLAVIVILAIIALIVTPVVNNIITSARVAANARSVEGHIRNVELVIMTKAFNEETGDLTAYDSEGSSLLPSLQASLPNNDDVVCSSYMIENGTITMALGCISERENWKELYSYTNVTGAEIIREFKGTLVSAGSTDTHKGIIYLDPTDLNRVCDSNSTLTSTNVGCKKFYIFDDEGSTYKMIMDRNLGNNVQYDATLTTPVISQIELVLRERTINWIGNPRLIDANEVAHIVGADLDDTIKWDAAKEFSANPTNFDTQISWFYLDGGRNANKASYLTSDGWQKQYATSAIKSKYVWLFDYTRYCNNYGCNHELDATLDYNIHGYWTRNTKGDTTNVWRVSYYGRLYGNDYNAYIGVRPVITLPKVLINS